MIHPPTFSEGPLTDHEIAELADLLESVEERLGLDELAGHLAWWVLRLSRAREERR
jgi:hypothetical protein